MGYVSEYYDELIAELIPVAEAAADEALEHFIVPDDDDASGIWNRIYHTTLDRLATERGIRRMTWQAITDEGN